AARAAGAGAREAARAAHRPHAGDGLPRGRAEHARAGVLEEQGVHTGQEPEGRDRCLVARSGPVCPSLLTRSEWSTGECIRDNRASLTRRAPGAARTTPASLIAIVAALPEG